MRNEPNFKHYTRGGQISFHNLRMWDQITKSLIVLCLFLWVVFTGLIIWFQGSPEKLQQAIVYYYASFLHAIGQKQTFILSFHGKNYRQPIEVITYYPYYAANAEQVLSLLVKSALEAFVMTLLVSFALAYYFIQRGKKQTASQFIRGSRIESPEHVKKK